jgi:hypothetical protein
VKPWRKRNAWAHGSAIGQRGFTEHELVVKSRPKKSRPKKSLPKKSLSPTENLGPGSHATDQV